MAVVLLKAGLVDCEGWDLFALWKKRQKLALDWEKRGRRLEHEKMVLRSSVQATARARSAHHDRVDDGTPIDTEEPARAAVRRTRSLIDAGDVTGALAAYDKAARSLFNWPSQPDLYELIKALHARGAEADSIKLMRDHCRHYPANSFKMRVKLAQI